MKLRLNINATTMLYPVSQGVGRSPVLGDDQRQDEKQREDAQAHFSAGGLRDRRRL
jgi:hypothetical protein